MEQKTILKFPKLMAKLRLASLQLNFSLKAFVCWGSATEFGFLKLLPMM